MHSSPPHTPHDRGGRTKPTPTHDVAARGRRRTCVRAAARPELPRHVGRRRGSQHVTRTMQHVRCSTHGAARTMQHARCSTRDAACKTQGAGRRTQLAAMAHVRRLRLAQGRFSPTMSSECGCARNTQGARIEKAHGQRRGSERAGEDVERTRDGAERLCTHSCTHTKTKMLAGWRVGCLLGRESRSAGRDRGSDGAGVKARWRYTVSVWHWCGCVRVVSDV